MRRDVCSPSVQSEPGRPERLSPRSLLPETYHLHLSSRAHVNRANASEQPLQRKEPLHRDSRSRRSGSDGCCQSAFRRSVSQRSQIGRARSRRSQLGPTCRGQSVARSRDLLSSSSGGRPPWFTQPRVLANINTNDAGSLDIGIGRRLRDGYGCCRSFASMAEHSPTMDWPESPDACCAGNDESWLVASFQT